MAENQPSNHGRQRGPTLLGELATLHCLASQGELLCTQGLTFLVNQPGAAEAFRKTLEFHSQLPLPRDLVWRAEPIQTDKGRPDMEGRSGATKWVKVEAKLGAKINLNQLLSFAGDLAEPARQFVVLLVPAKRRQEAERTLGTYPASRISESSWRFASGGLVVLMTWEHVFEQLGTSQGSSSQGNLEQLVGLYEELNAMYVAPVDADGAEDRARDPDLVRLVDRATRIEGDRLGHAVMPFGTERLVDGDGGSEMHSFRRRYVVALDGLGRMVSLAVGVRPPFVGYKTRVWARLGHDSPGFKEIRARLDKAKETGRRKYETSGRQLWFPLEVPSGQHADDVVNELTRQLAEIWRDAGILSLPQAVRGPAVGES